MNKQIKIDTIVSLVEDFPSGLNHLDLAGNKEFINWFLPRLEILR